MIGLFKPRFVNLTIDKRDYIQLIKEIIKKECDVDVEPDLSIDDETGYVRIIIDEDDITEEECERLIDNGFDIREWYLMTDSILRCIFNTDKVYSYDNDFTNEESCLNNLPDDYPVPIQIDYSEYIKLNKV